MLLLDGGCINMYLFLWVLQACYDPQSPGRDTQGTQGSWLLWCLYATMASYLIVYVVCRSTYEVIRMLRTSVLMLQTVSRIIKPQSTSVHFMAEPLTLLLMVYSTCHGLLMYQPTKLCQIHVLINYLYWLLAWIHLLYYGGRAVEELRNVGRQPYVRLQPKSSKKRKVRRPKLPFFKRNLHRKRVRKRLKSSCTGEGWADDGDPLQGLRSWPYWKTLHLSVIGDLWDDLCTRNPDILTATIGNEDSFLKSMSSHYSDRVLQLGFFGDNFNLTEATATSNLFRFQSIFHVQSDVNGAPIIFDSGASITITPYKEDFIGDIDYSSSAIGNVQLLGVSEATQIIGVGKIKLMVHTDTGAKRNIITTAYLVPNARVRLLSLLRYKEDYIGQGCSFLLDDRGCTFTFPRSIGGGKITFDYRGRNNFIPRTTAYSQSYAKPARKHHKVFMVLEDSNLNLTSAQKELLKWHFCLGHFNMQWIQRLFTKKILTSLETNITSRNAICKCMACQFAKQTRRPEGTSTQKIKPEKDGNLKKGILRPGAMISSDQFVSSVPGRLPNTYGRERDSEKFVGGTIFIDEASGYFGVSNQVSLNAGETIKAKHSFERDAIRHGVIIRGYRADNGTYRSKEFREDIAKFGQTLQFCGVGAHHQNGIAERGIRTVSTAARAMLLHSMIHWPEHVSLDLWPFAIKYAVYLYNRLPSGTSGLSPLEIFFDTTSDHQELRGAKVWGCPAYVLDPRIQDGKKIPRWNPRSRMGQFLGRSDEHASSIGLIRNLKTGAVSAQFHVVYDNHFSTVQSDWTADNLPVPPCFHDLYRFSREQHYDPDDVIEERRRKLLNVDRGQKDSGVEVRHLSENERSSEAPEGARKQDRSVQQSQNPSQHPQNSGGDRPEVVQENNKEAVANNRGNLGNQDHSIDSTHESNLLDSDSDDDYIQRPSVKRSSPSRKNGPKAGHTRSGRQYQGSSATSRTRSGAQYLGFNIEPDQSYTSFVLNLADRMDVYDAFLIETDLNSKSNHLTDCFEAFSIYQRLDEDLDVSTGLHPFAFSARANAEDTPRFHEAMKSPDREGFISAMKKELAQLASMDAFVAVPREKALNEGKPVIDSVWAFKRKRYPDGSVKKLKARFCVRGDLQKEHIDYFDTYSPVVQWSTVRLLLIVSIILQLETKQVDFTLAFVQAKADPGIYIEMPRMFEMDGYVLELKRNLYGQCDAPLKFYEHLKLGLSQRGFEPSKFDPCLFKSKDTMILTYIDDCIFFNKKKQAIDGVISSLRKDEIDGRRVEEFILEVEGDYAGFLGISITECTSVTGALELLQTGLIDKILVTLSLDDEFTTTRSEPAAVQTLGKDENGPARREHWSYSSVVGMMLYLASNSRPDIAFAVNQCARFSHCPKLVHEKALKRIARYLKGTKTQGLILKPNQDLRLDLYADADFAGLWKIEDADDPISVRSRTGYIVTLSGLPVSWSSKLQTEIATSTMMAEYVALSTGMRELLPLTELFNEICSSLKIKRTENSKVVRAFEDNEGALSLASKPLPQCTPRSKHFAVKYHWFREKLQQHKIKILPIDTSLQQADIFTKGLGRKEFQEKRLLLMGW